MGAFLQGLFSGSINYCLELHGRYSHTQAYVERLLTCSGLRSKIVQAELRTEAGCARAMLVSRQITTGSLAISAEGT
jgi:predicted TPR repeat methyltransferase